MNAPPAPTASWATQQLAELLASVSKCESEAEAIRVTVERAAEALDADVAAALSEKLEAAIGFARGEAPEAALFEIAAGKRDALEVPGPGSCRVTAVPVDDGRLEWLVVARGGEEEFDSEDRTLLRAMGKVLALALRQLKLIAGERALREESERQRREHERLAVHDSLTGLPNRVLLEDRLTHALARAARTRTKVAVLFCDLDTFKTVNDSLGHAAGDEVLAAAATRITHCIRPGDTAARFGGDEFVILLEDVNEHDVAPVAQRILDVLAEPFIVGRQEVFVSASIGIAVGSEGVASLLRSADLALYRAKERGKGRHELFKQEMHTEVVERMELEGDLQRALQREELVVHYQPIVRLSDGEIMGTEALVRWQHPERGLLPPGDFVPIAENSRLMVPLGRWILQEACNQAAEWHERYGKRAPTMGVNISTGQLEEPGFTITVAEALRETGLSPRALVLELTETSLMHDTEAVSRTLNQLRRLWVRIAVDDFGTGYFSLRHLRRFPIDMLKIAKEFVDGIATDPDDGAITRAIVDLAGSFGLTLVAEGIEHEAQRTRLRELGCELGQGFHFAHPMPPEEIEAMLERPPSGVDVAKL